jgi:sugar/nucleoside kinase (ribokinase family)
MLPAQIPERNQMATAALQFPLCHHSVASVILGGQNVDEVSRRAAIGRLKGLAELHGAIAAARQGALVGYLSALGNDDFGAALIACWRAEDIDIKGVRQSEIGRTGIYFADTQPARS